MTHDEKMKLAREFFEQCLDIQEKKGRDYMVDGDVWKDVIEEAADLEITPERLMFIFMHKHYKAVRRFCTKGRVESEPIEGRLTDLVNYASMLRVYLQSQNIKERK